MTESRPTVPPLLWWLRSVSNLLQGSPAPKFSEPGSECLRGPWDPKGGELYHSMSKPWETVVEDSRCSDVQIV